MYIWIRAYMSVLYVYILGQALKCNGIELEYFCRKRLYDRYDCDDEDAITKLERR